MSMSYRSSKFWPLVLLLFTLGISEITCINTSNALRTDNISSKQPLGINTGTENQELLILLGTNDTVTIYATEDFSFVFQNATKAILSFRYDEADVIKILENITLKDSHSSLFTNKSIPISPLKAGRVTIKSFVNVTPKTNSSADINVDNIFIKVSAYKNDILLTISEVVGWLYFIAWSISFYPQIYQNWSRKSVRGLSLDFVFLNITGFSAYGIYNIGLFWVPSIQNEYMAEDPAAELPVQLNDVVFTLHALFACTIVVIQCLLYDKGSQTISSVGRTLLGGIFTFIFIIFIVALSQAITWLLFLSICSYVKLFITLIKYIPQAYLNWSRQSTSGWSIGNVLLDFTGGILSITQMFIIDFNFDDWSSLTGDFAKFGLGLFSVSFDIFFIIQHYILYKNHGSYEPIEGGTIINNNPVTSSNHHHHNDELVTSRQHDQFATTDDDQQDNSIHEIVDSTS